MDNQQQPDLSTPPSPIDTPSVATPTQQPTQATASSSTPTPAVSTSTAIQPHASKAKRAAYFIFGLLLVLLSLSIVQGQATHSWNIAGIIMILVFGIPGSYILYYSVFSFK